MERHSKPYIITEAGHAALGDGTPHTLREVAGWTRRFGGAITVGSHDLATVLRRLAGGA